MAVAPQTQTPAPKTEDKSLPFPINPKDPRYPEWVQTEGQKKVLVYSIFPEFEINVSKQYRHYERTTTGENAPISRGVSRVIRFINHRAWIPLEDMEDKPDVNQRGGVQRGIRKLEGYGRDFIEAIDTPGLPEGAKSLQGLFTSKQNAQFDSFIHQMARKNKMSVIQGPRQNIEVSDIIGELIEVKAGRIKAPEERGW